MRLTDEQMLILRVVRQTLKEPGCASGGERAVYDCLRTIIEAGLTTAAIGSLDATHKAGLRSVLDDEQVLNAIAREIWWNEKVVCE